MMPVRASSWIVQNGNRHARARLFCFPFAGAGASVFRPWMNLFPMDLEVCAVQLPGREGRVRERPFRHMTSLAHSAVQALLPFLDRPYVLFGHSMGGLLAFEVARGLEKLGCGTELLIASGVRAPHLPRKVVLKYDLPEDQLVAELARMEGTPPEVLADRELLDLLLPTLRADLEVLETYTCTGAEALRSPIAALGGEGDRYIAPEEIDSWRAWASVGFLMKILPGSHFFLLENQRLTIQTITECIRHFQQPLFGRGK